MRERISPLKDTFQPRPETKVFNETIFEQEIPPVVTGETDPLVLHVRRALETINESLLKDICLEYVRRSGVGGEGRWVPFNTFALTRSGDDGIMLGETMMTTGIEIDTKAAFDKSVLVHVVVHEELHCLTSLLIYCDFGDSFSLKSAVGVSTSYGKEVKTLKFFNEGLTEIITDKIVAEYARRSGELSSSELQNFEEIYTEARKLVRLYVQFFTICTGVDEKEIWQGVEHEYFSNTGNLYMSDAYDTIFGEENAEFVAEQLFTAINSGSSKKFIDTIRTFNILGLISDSQYLTFIEKTHELP